MSFDFSRINGHDRAKIARIAMVYDLPSPYSFQYGDAENADWLDLLGSAVCDACRNASYLTDNDFWHARQLLMWFDLPETRETLQGIIKKHKAFEDEEERKANLRRRRMASFSF